jgi:hypothetical protein
MKKKEKALFYERLSVVENSLLEFIKRFTNQFFGVNERIENLEKELKEHKEMKKEPKLGDKVNDLFKKCNDDPDSKRIRDAYESAKSQEQRQKHEVIKKQLNDILIGYYITDISQDINLRFLSYEEISKKIHITLTPK